MDRSKKPLLKRRAVLFGAVATIAAGGATAAYFYRPNYEGGALTVTEAHQAAVAGDVFLVDVRRPDEWEKTGVGVGANPIDMRRDDFIAELDKLTDGAKDAPVALICARGVRSARLSNQLTEAGYTNIIDVPEGMLGSTAGPGWLKTGLPTKTPQG